MTHTKTPSLLSVPALILLIAASGAAQPAGGIDTTPPPPILVTKLGGGCQVFQDYNQGSPGASLNVQFAGSQWLFHIDNLGLKGPWIDTVSFKGGSWSSYRLVAKQAGLAEIYVKYHTTGVGISDLQNTNPNSVAEIKTADLPAAGGGLVTLWHQKGSQFEADPFPRIGVECHERGIDWLCKQPPGKQPAVNLIGRAYEVIVWAVIDGGNYDNIIQYVFRDDGSLGFRLGTSGYLNQRPDLVPGEPHMHNALWRLSTNLFGRSDNRVYLAEHNETGNTASDSENLIPQEGYYDWDPLKFTSILVQNKTLKNARGNFMGYELTPWGRTGTARHSEDWTKPNTWTNHDFWITKDRPGEDGSGSNAPNNWRFFYQTPENYMGTYAIPPESLDTSMTPVLWYRSSFHHHRSDHDLDKNGGVGIVSAHWAGFDFQPDNAFDFNPVARGASKCGL